MTSSDELSEQTNALRETLENFDGIAEVTQEIGGLDYTLELAIEDPALADQATRDALDAFHESGVPKALAEKAANYEAEPRVTLSIVEPGTSGNGPHLDLPISTDLSTDTIATAAVTWVTMSAIEGIRLYAASFTSSGFAMECAVDFEGLLAGVRPPAAIAELNQILTDNGYDPAESSIKPAISAPEVLNSVGGEEKSVRGSRFVNAHDPVQAIAGPNYGSVLYFIPGDYEVDMYVLPKLAEDGTLLPLDLTEESVSVARQEIQAQYLYTAWELRDVIVFTQDGTQVFGPQ
ncbi:hypothetical protein MUN78_02945 [Leucobacter allii]|uniref:Bacteriocin n=1 Tax=Leucobacter allii TaxID=2932247 RepID=A0ABY4FNI0_9MICO|nr:hypothetical protein [Leucobacter allii]UOQ57810.1 hypothetical protein MUN78_02945 [Leucobacter allii]